MLNKLGKTVCGHLNNQILKSNILRVIFSHCQQFKTLLAYLMTHIFKDFEETDHCEDNLTSILLHGIESTIT